MSRPRDQRLGGRGRIRAPVCLALEPKRVPYTLPPGRTNVTPPFLLGHKFFSGLISQVTSPASHLADRETLRGCGHVPDVSAMVVHSRHTQCHTWPAHSGSMGAQWAYSSHTAAEHNEHTVVAQWVHGNAQWAHSGSLKRPHATAQWVRGGAQWSHRGRTQWGQSGHT